jgi:hypothetical protein
METGLEVLLRMVSKASQACDASPSFSVKQSTQWTYLKNGKLDTLTTRSGAVGTGGHCCVG